jgi:methenyltetrahydrofolate cyclohydrolase
MSVLHDMTLGTYLDAVSSADPTPGGGSVAALAAALAAALGCMVAAISADKAPSRALREIAARCASLRETFLRLGDEDQMAFDGVMTALRLDKTDPLRNERLESSLQSAADVPLSVGGACLGLLADLESLAPLASRHAVSDVGASAHLAMAALSASLLNVHINVSFMKKRETARTYELAADKMESEGRARSERIVGHVAGRIRG